MDVIGKTLILSERFYPEEFLVNDLANGLKSSGMDLEVLTQVPSYPHDQIYAGYKNKLFQTTEEFSGIKIHRVKTYCGYNKSVVIKIFNYLNFAFLTSLWCCIYGWRYRRVFIYHTGPLTMATAAVIMKFIWWKKCTIWTQDVWPDAVYAYGFKPTWWKRLLLDTFIRIIYSACDHIAVSSPGFVEKLRPYSDEKVEFLPQWNQIDFAAAATDDKKYPGCRVFTFAGNLGAVQNLDVLVEAFGELKLKNCILQLVGGGVYLEHLQNIVKQKGYENIVFTGRLPQSSMPEVFAASDVMIISLKKDFSLTVPAKFQAYIAAGKAVLGIIGGDCADLINKYDLGMSAEPEKESIKKALKEMSDTPVETIRKWGKNSLQLSQTEFSRSNLIGRIKNMLGDYRGEGINKYQSRFLLTGITLLGALLILLQRIMEPEMGRDSALYLLLISKWSAGGFEAVLEYWPTFWIPPLYLYAATLLTHAGLSPETAAVGICMVCGMLLPLISFAITREILSSRKIALGAALLTAVNPTVVDFSATALRDIPYVFFIGWTLFFIIAGIKRQKWQWWAVGGIAFACAVLCRLETFELLPLLGIYFIIALWKKHQKWYIMIRDFAILGASAAAAVILLLFASGTSSSMADRYWQRIKAHISITKAIYQGDSQK